MARNGISMLQKLFKLQQHNTNVKAEIIGGLTTFAAMSYILVVNPQILSNAGMDKNALITITALAAAFGCFLMAGLTNYPIALAPGMSTNSYFAFIICLGAGATWQQALGMVFWNGVIFFLLSLSGFRTKIANEIPEPIKVGIQCGIGLFIAFIGLQKAGLVVSNPHTITGLGDLFSPTCLTVLAGLILMLVLSLKRVSGAIIYSILLISILGTLIPNGDNGHLTAIPSSIFSFPPSVKGTFLGLDILYPITHFKETYSTIFTLFLLDLFDTIGTVLGVARRAHLVGKNNRIDKIGSVMTVDAIATATGALMGTSTTTAYIESAAGIEAGGRTGLTTVVVGICFLASLFITPIIQVIPGAATAPALIIVGLFMVQGIKLINLDDLSQAAPAFLTMLMIPLSFSITEGISLGILFYIGMMVLCNKAKQVSRTTYILGFIFVLNYILN